MSSYMDCLSLISTFLATIKAQLGKTARMPSTVFLGICHLIEICLFDTFCLTKIVTQIKIHQVNWKQFQSNSFTYNIEFWLIEKNLIHFYICIIFISIKFLDCKLLVYYWIWDQRYRGLNFLKKLEIENLTLAFSETVDSWWWWWRLKMLPL